MTREEILFQKFIKILNSVKIKPSGCIPLETVKIVVSDFLKVIYTPKPIWISVKDDLPCNYEELLDAKCKTKKVFVLKFGGFPDVDYMLKIDGKWTWFAYKNSKFWMPIPELPKE